MAPARPVLRPVDCLEARLSPGSAISVPTDPFGTEKKRLPHRRKRPKSREENAQAWHTRQSTKGQQCCPFLMPLSPCGKTLICERATLADSDIATTKVFTSGDKHLYRCARLMTVGLSARSQLCSYVSRRTGLSWEPSKACSTLGVGVLMLKINLAAAALAAALLTAGSVGPRAEPLNPALRDRFVWFQAGSALAGGHHQPRCAAHWYGRHVHAGTRRQGIELLLPREG
jgi:hypothetical protein